MIVQLWDAQSSFTVHSQQSHNPCTRNIILNWVWILLVIEGWRLCKRDGVALKALEWVTYPRLYGGFLTKDFYPLACSLDNQRCIAHKRSHYCAHHDKLGIDIIWLKSPHVWEVSNLYHQLALSIVIYSSWAAS
jgi:hypothetical protein